MPDAKRKTHATIWDYVGFFKLARRFELLTC